MNKVTTKLAGDTPSEIRLVISVAFGNSRGERAERFRILTLVARSCLVPKFRRQEDRDLKVRGTLFNFHLNVYTHVIIIRLK